MNYPHVEFDGCYFRFDLTNHTGDYREIGLKNVSPLGALYSLEWIIDSFEEKRLQPVSVSYLFENIKK